MTDHDTIVIRAPAGTKTRWVRQSQAEGKKLSDWVVDKIDQPADPERYLSRSTPREPGSVAVLSEPELREVMRAAYVAGAKHA